MAAAGTRTTQVWPGGTSQAWRCSCIHEQWWSQLEPSPTALEQGKQGGPEDCGQVQSGAQITRQVPNNESSGKSVPRLGSASGWGLVRVTRVGHSPSAAGQGHGDGPGWDISPWVLSAPEAQAWYNAKPMVSQSAFLLSCTNSSSHPGFLSQTLFLIALNSWFRYAILQEDQAQLQPC